MSNIFALATSPIKSGVAIFRISGPESFRCINELTQQPLPSLRQASIRKIYNPANMELIDECLVILFKGPNSFTGEDVAELHIHGSIAIIKELNNVMASFENFRPAEAGEFSRRAFENGLMDLTEAEGLADLIDAQTKFQAKIALRQTEGQLHKLYENWREELIKILANIEAYIDFPDEDLPQDLVKQIEKQILDMKQEISSYITNSNNIEQINHGLHIVILGAPNTGKSSLINCLAKKDIAIVSDRKGTTRDLIEVPIDLDGYPLIISDTAGIRDSNDEIEEEGVKRAIARAASADLKLVIFDQAELPKIDKQSLDLADNDSIILISKKDLQQDISIPKELESRDIVRISALSEDGLDLLLKKIKSYAEKFFNIASDGLVVRQRHLDLLKETLTHLDHFDMKNDLDLVAEDIRLASRSLGKITGKIDVEDVLDKIFSEFCIGK